MPRPGGHRERADVVGDAGVLRARRNRPGSSWACPTAARSAGAGCARSARRCCATRRRRSRCRRRPTLAGSSAITPFAVSQRPSMMRLQHRLAFGVARCARLRRRPGRRGSPETAPTAPRSGRTGPSRCSCASSARSALRNSRRPISAGTRRRVVRPVGRERVGARRGERDQRGPFLARVLDADLFVVGGDLGDVGRP